MRCVDFISTELFIKKSSLLPHSRTGAPPPPGAMRLSPGLGAGSLLCRCAWLILHLGGPRAWPCLRGRGHTCRRHQLHLTAEGTQSPSGSRPDVLNGLQGIRWCISAGACSSFASAALCPLLHDPERPSDSHSPHRLPPVSFAVCHCLCCLAGPSPLGAAAMFPAC